MTDSLDRQQRSRRKCGNLPPQMIYICDTAAMPRKPRESAFPCDSTPMDLAIQLGICRSIEKNPVSSFRHVYGHCPSHETPVRPSPGRTDPVSAPAPNRFQGGFHGESRLCSVRPHDAPRGHPAKGARIRSRITRSVEHPRLPIGPSRCRGLGPRSSVRVDHAGGSCPLPGRPRFLACSGYIGPTPDVHYPRHRLHGVFAGQHAPTPGGRGDGGIRRTKGIAQHPKDALVAADVKELVATCGDDLRGTRDRCVLLLTFAGAFRRSEVVRILFSDVEFCSQGAVVHLRTSKIDQEGVGRHVGLPFGSDPSTCPVIAIKQWLEASWATAGPLFRSIDRFGRLSERGMHPESIALIVKCHARAAGKNPDLLGAHSLRAGHVTEAHLRGLSDRAVMRQTGHRSAKSLDRYTRPKGVFLENSAAGLRFRADVREKVLFSPASNPAFSSLRTTRGRN